MSARLVRGLLCTFVIAAGCTDEVPPVGPGPVVDMAPDPDAVVDALVSPDRGEIDAAPDPEPDAAVDAGPMVDGCAPTAEVCNGLDDDCDGATDEGTDGLDCVAGGLGLCARGRVVCVDGAEACRAPVPGPELCNGLDDDCDGAADEQAVEGGACDTGRPGACAPGVRACTEDGVVCAPTVSPQRELCNGEDDDCDGRVDEGDPEGGLACVVDGGAACDIGATRCVDGALSCVAGEPGAELCNGLDDDCDEGVDEAVPVAPCPTGLPGVCAEGATACVGGQQFCEPVQAPGVERCNGLDDDCDGAVDEEAPGAGPCDTGAQGVCGAGQRVCVQGRLVCRPDLRPGIEDCNGLDDDCDGGVDEGAPESGFACDSGDAGQCVAGVTACVAGVRRCVPGAPGPEQCNAVDDDCDGETDERVATGADCLTGQPGRCALGVDDCVGGAAVCARASDPGEEQCNGLDDDCDGSTDEFSAEAGTACATGLFGACAAGTRICEGGQARCVPDVAPAVEVCNGEDDDCDGATDEQAADVGRACNPGGADGECRTGRTICEAGALACLAGPAGFERCDGADDDCDGRVDEQVPQGGACDSGQPGVCAAGGLACLDGALVCRPAAVPAAEVCNGLDDDCDGATDEGTAGQRCDTGAAGVCGAGRTACDAGVPACVPSVAATPERCNGLDDDCDGASDEGDPESGLACDSDEGGACRAGATACVDGALVCAAGDPGAEQCNGVDDDCDGSTDEGAAAGACVTGRPGRCRAGTGACVDGVASCVSDLSPVAETCNGIDDDCDGRADEGTGGAACATGRPGLCAAGVVACEAGAPVCVAVTDPDAETCDGADEDCDGRVDEGDPGGGLGCDPGGVEGQCRAGRTACVVGQVVCRPGAAGAERCNGADDDCDGVTDEGSAGGACATGQAGVCAAGRLVCRDGATVCVADRAPGAETCDGADEDCDGRTDEGLLGGGGCDTGLAGVCAAGTRVCRAGQAACVPAQAAGPERCNGLDDDCDGAIDEGDPEAGAACDRGMGQGECAVGTTACIAGALVCEAGEGGVEQCNGVDDDCDDGVDEEVATGLACATGQPGVCSAGATDCRAGSTACDPRQMPGAERCNGIDDDCDGTTDEGTGGAACDTGAPGRCRAGVIVCGDGAPGCQRISGPVAETCNGLDDDCDGRADEGEPGAGQGCDPGGVEGVCATGSTACIGGALVCEAGDPGAERCNGVDDDCDGRLDEAVPAGGACATGQAGACAAGTRRCVGGATACVPDVGPAAERCDGVDEDCDGRVDEGTGGAACDTGADGPCATGRLTCADGALICAGLVQPGAETCDGSDEDCDGAVDEGDPGAGDACDPEGVEGVCATGTTACEGGAIACVAGDPGAEVCDGEDDDCDGATDEAVPVRACVTGRPGVCAGGTTTCIGGVAGCAPDRAAGPEACNGLDDDCDGRTDEGLSGAACDTGAEGICAAGATSCTGGVLRCVPASAARAERCDGLDDDCDGLTDEGGPGAGVACDPGGAAGACATGATACVAGAVICEPGDPGAETCNGLDDDCDGATDEAAPAGGACDTGLPGLCAPGDLDCRGGARVCVGRRAPVAETCNGLDDDCDGATDEGTGGEGCGTGEAGACAVGATACVGGATVCRQTVQPTAEVCNGADDDCDGASDEGGPGAGLGCDPGGVEGACATGATACLGGAIVCQPGDPGAEVCNGLDDDCDAALDEDVPVVACRTGRPGVCADGTTLCIDGASGCAQTTPAGPEACNGLDDDCDGRADEGDPGGGACDTGADGICAAGALICADGALECRPLQAARAEQCNGLDDDCDGTADEGDPGAGQACDPGPGQPGECRAGLTACVGGGLVCNPEAQGAEACNGLDDDCDGTADEEVAEGGDCDTGRLGICADGVQLCENGAVVCAPEASPVAEQCNGLDDDCDGAVDDGDPGGGADCDTGRPGVCGPGIETCQGGAIACAAVIAAGPERCNGLDDDCDGAIDEGDPGGGIACPTGDQGICATGRTACEGGVIACEPLAVAGAETCDGLDEDCDGATDEGTGGAACPSGRPGRCGPGAEVCRAGVLVCEAALSPIAETCDGADEDCDGATDEGDPGGGGACDTGEPGRCGPGAEQCRGGALVCEAAQGPVAETCDGTDEDCDGVIDNGDPGGGVACDTGRDGLCAAGLTACRGGALACDQTVGPVAEQCNGLDDDCDGAIDEGDPGGGAACDTGQDGLCAAGTERCVDGGLACVRDTALTGEVCDGLDQDCDGAPDEGDPGGGGACDTGVPGACAAGVEACRGGAIVCDQPVQPVAETCDGVDEDCDGVVDNGDPGGGVACDTGIPGLCGPGTTACVGGAVQCVSDTAPQPETCDDSDENCDGVVDDGDPGGGAPCDTGALGVCADGTERCVDGDIECVPDTAPGAEACNGLDDDCDGRVDEVRPAPCPTGLPGQCNLGVSICEQAATRCQPVFEPGDACEEEGTGTDEDCDGVVDERPDIRCLPAEIQLVRSCLPDNDIEVALSMVVDPVGTPHLARVARVLGDLIYTVVDVDGVPTDETVANGISLLGNDETRATDIVLFGGQPAICYHDARQDHLAIALRTGPAAWRVEVVVAGADAGRYCDLELDGQGRLSVAYQNAGALHYATRTGQDAYVIEVADDNEARVGEHLDYTNFGGVPVIAHHDPNAGTLRLSARLNAEWATAFTRPATPAGWRPALVLDGNGLQVLHGSVPDDPDLGSDGVLYLTTGSPVTLQLATVVFDGDPVGGWVSAYRGSTDTIVFARERLRSALFGAQDALHVYTAPDVGARNLLESSGNAQQRHSYLWLGSGGDPFGLPVLSYADRRGAFGADPGTSLVCLYRPLDTDRDRLPDSVELEIGTNPDDPDTDADGVDDGQELLIDGTDPTQG